MILVVDFFLNLIEVLVLVLSALFMVYGIFQIVINMVRGFRLNRWLKKNYVVLGRILANSDIFLATMANNSACHKKVPRNNSDGVVPSHFSDSQPRSGEYTEPEMDSDIEN